MILKRIGASVFDFIVLLGIVTFLPQFVTTQPEMTVVEASSLLLFFGLCILHSFFFLASMSATPGKLVFGLRIVQNDGSRINLKQAFLRTLFSIGGGWLLGPGIKASAFLNIERRHWYDIYLGTKVVTRKGVAANLPVRKNLGWILVIVLTGFFIVNHALSLRSLNYDSGRIIFYNK